jgi:L-serine dehydratase
MSVSVFDLFKIGIGPSSSHTVGPMRAAARFAKAAAVLGQQKPVVRIKAELYGSLGATGKGHGSDRAVMLGLEDLAPDTIDPESIEPRINAITASRCLQLAGHLPVAFDVREDLLFFRKSLPFHPNGMRFRRWRLRRRGR